MLYARVRGPQVDSDRSRGRSSAVERRPSMPNVEGSNPFARFHVIVATVAPEGHTVCMGRHCNSVGQ